jgi:hypothetical protein
MMDLKCPFLVCIGGVTVPNLQLINIESLVKGNKKRNQMTHRIRICDTPTRQIYTFILPDPSKPIVGVKQQISTSMAELLVRVPGSACPYLKFHTICVVSIRNVQTEVALFESISVKGPNLVWIIVPPITSLPHIRKKYFEFTKTSIHLNPYFRPVCKGAEDSGTLSDSRWARRDGDMVLAGSRGIG